MFKELFTEAKRLSDKEMMDFPTRNVNDIDLSYIHFEFDYENREIRLNGITDRDWNWVESEPRCCNFKRWPDQNLIQMYKAKDYITHIIKFVNYGASISKEQLQMGNVNMPKKYMRLFK